MAELGGRNFAQDRCFFDTPEMKLEVFTDASLRPRGVFAFLLSPRGWMLGLMLQW